MHKSQTDLLNVKLKMENGKLNTLKFFNFQLSIFNSRIGFTLAEVLITLAVIGVVAAVTMPILMTNINERVNSERHANIAFKITQAMENMRAHGRLVQYASTDAFVDELQKYLKIAKRCSASNIAECWPTETIIDSSGNEYKVADCKYRKDLLNGSHSNDNNVGLILADGTSIILTYDKNEKGLDIGDKISSETAYPLPIGNGKIKNFPYTTGVTSSIDFVTDVNGKKGPNKETQNNKYYDIRSFKLASFKNGCIDGPAGCILYFGPIYSAVDCSNEDNNDYIYCGNKPSGKTSDNYAGAQKACALSNMHLADVSELNNIYNNRNQYPTLINETGWFKSSSEYDETTTWYINFGTGQRNNFGKGGIDKIICIAN